MAMRPLRVAALLTGAVYLLWRAVFTWEGANPILFVLLFAAELFGFVRLLMTTSLVGEPRAIDRTPEVTSNPDGDVVVVVTDEPASEVRAAVLSARLISGYAILRIVDRDDRPDVAELADRLGIVRIAGTRGADLGELIDIALNDCNAKLTLIAPADLVIMPDVLQVTADTFDDRDVAVVVCRVENTNAEEEVDFGGYGEHRRRDELITPKLDDAGVLPWWPGMAVVRRSAIRNIGGMSRGRDGVTLSTGVRLQAEGWRITDIPVLVARRLAPWNDDRHLHRWARDLHERLSVLVDRDAPRKNEYATRLGRRAYRGADLVVGRSLQRLVLIGVLFATMYSSSLPMVAEPVPLVALWSAWMVSSVLHRREVYRATGFVSWMSSDLRLLATDLVVAGRALPGKTLNIDLVDAAPGRLLRRVLLVGLQVGLAASIVVFALGVARPRHGDFATLALLAISAWLWLMVLQARSSLKLRQVRQNFRTFDELRVVASEGRMAVIGVSPFGLDVITAKPLRVGANVRIAFELPQVDGSPLRFECPTKVRRSSREGRHHAAYLRFAILTDVEVDQITEYCAVVAGVESLRDRTNEPAPAQMPIAATVVQPRVIAN